MLVCMLVTIVEVFLLWGIFIVQPHLNIIAQTLTSNPDIVYLPFQVNRGEKLGWSAWLKNTSFPSRIHITLRSQNDLLMTWWPWPLDHMTFWKQDDLLITWWPLENNMTFQSRNDHWITWWAFDDMMTLGSQDDLNLSITRWPLHFPTTFYLISIKFHTLQSTPQTTCLPEWNSLFTCLHDFEY